jgi:hypothetical protein
MHAETNAFYFLRNVVFKIHTVGNSAMSRLEADTLPCRAGYHETKPRRWRSPNHQQAARRCE